jgi:hypothetical protein
MPDETVREILERNAQRLLTLPGVVAVAEGESDGRACITVFVAETTAAVLAEIPFDLEGRPVVVRESGEFSALDE